MDDLKPYTVEKHEGVGCPHCGADEMWDVVFHSGADDEIGLSTAYGDEDEAENVARDCNDAYAKGLTALKLAATEQATHAKAVLKERTRERDEFERKGKELCVAYGTALITIHDLTRERDEALKEVEALKLQAQVWASEARAQRATVHACYEAITGKTGEPGDWNGAEPIRRYVAERDALALSQGRLLGMLKDWRMNLYPRDHAKYCRASVKYPDWPDPKDDRCDLCKRTDAAIAEATPEGGKQ